MSRPSFFLEHAEKVMQFTRVMTDDDGCICTWIYDYDVNKVSGLISVDIEYPKGYDFRTPEEKLKKEQKGLNKTEMKYLNPLNGKQVSYQRYHQLIKEGKIKV